MENGGTFIYVTSENLNTIGDTSEYQDNQNYALTILRRLHKKFPKYVEIYFLPTPVNCTMYYMKEMDGNEFINVKFNFQTYHHKENQQNLSYLLLKLKEVQNHSKIIWNWKLPQMTIVLIMLIS